LSDARLRTVGTERDIVWIHGFPLSSEVFDAVRQIRGARHHLIDLPGFGAGSSTDVPSTIEGFARAVLAAVDAAAIQEATFAGVSMGGYVAMAIAKMVPERVDGLILIDTRETADDPAAREKRTSHAARVEAEGTAFLIEEMFPKMLTQRAGEAIRSGVRQSMESASIPGVVAGLRAMRDRPSSEQLLRSIDVPVLIVVGEEDAITPVADAERMHRMLRRGTLLRLPEAAHLSHLEQPKRFRDGVERFIGAGRDAAGSGTVRNLGLALIASLSLFSVACEDEITPVTGPIQTVENTPLQSAPIETPPTVDLTETERKISQTERIALQREGRLKPGEELEIGPRISLPFSPPIAMDPVDGSKISITADTPTHRYKGKIYYFNTSGNKAAFIADPERFVKGALSRY
jgi:pimeloyl-ACP methyl ester carboxylesterase/YHS domain-containing protein